MPHIDCQSRSTHQVEIFPLHDLDVADPALELAPQHRVDLVLLAVLRCRHSSMGMGHRQAQIGCMTRLRLVTPGCVAGQQPRGSRGSVQPPNHGMHQAIALSVKVGDMPVFLRHNVVATPGP